MFCRFNERTWQLMNDAQDARSYPLDVMACRLALRPSASIGTQDAIRRNMNWRQMDTQATLQTFASMTGGRAYSTQ